MHIRVLPSATRGDVHDAIGAHLLRLRRREMKALIASASWSKSDVATPYANRVTENTISVTVEEERGSHEPDFEPES
jgi:hypothetical protein